MCPAICDETSPNRRGAKTLAVNLACRNPGERESLAEVRHELDRTAEIEIGIHARKDRLDACHIEPARPIEVSAHDVLWSRPAIRHMQGSSRRRRDQTSHLLLQGMMVAVPSDMKKMNRATIASGNMIPEHGEHGCHADPGTRADNRPIAGLEKEFSGRRPRSDRITHFDRIVKET